MYLFLAQISNPGDKEKSNNKPKYAKVLQIVLYTLDDTVVSPYHYYSTKSSHGREATNITQKTSFMDFV